MTPDTRLRDELKAHLAASDQSVASIAQASGVTYARLLDWLNGRKADINLSTAVKVFDAAGLPLTCVKRTAHPSSSSNPTVSASRIAAW